MKTALKHKNDEFLVMPLKYVLSVMGLVNHPGTPKLWAIAHENSHKHKNDEFLVMSIKYVLRFMGLVNQPGTPKLWAIAHENGLKMQKTTSFWSCHSNMY
jgi:fatty-acid desaturase